MVGKRFIYIVFSVFFSFILVLFSGCDVNFVKENTSFKVSTEGEKEITSLQSENKKTDTLRALWLSCYDMKKTTGYSKKEFEAFAKEVVNNAYLLGYNTIFFHIRPFGDAFYKSSLFPFSEFLTGTRGQDPGFDPLEIFIAQAKDKGIELHGWINPYRMSQSDDYNNLTEDELLRSWLNDKSGRAKAFGGRFYLDPGHPDCIDIVLKGVKEVLENYNIDGIHFDDYFYPTTSPEFDKDTYSTYTKNGGKLSLDDWRRANVNSLVASVYRLCGRYKKTFGISPSAHISLDKTDKNYNEAYADIALWIREEGFVNYIAPQLYFGYEYKTEEFKFNNLLNLWGNMPKEKNISVYIGIGAYKIDQPTAADGDEWKRQGKELVLRQISDCLDKGFDGYAVFSYEQAVKYNLNWLRP